MSAAQERKAAMNDTLIARAAHRWPDPKRLEIPLTSGCFGIKNWDAVSNPIELIKYALST